MKKTIDLSGEMGELRRVATYLNREEGYNISVTELIDAFQNSKERVLDNKVWDKLENTESNEIVKGDIDAVNKIAKKYKKTKTTKGIILEEIKNG